MIGYKRVSKRNIFCEIGLCLSSLGKRPMSDFCHWGKADYFPWKNSCSTKVFEKRSLTELTCTVDIYFKIVYSSLTFLRCSKFKIKKPQFCRHNLYYKEMFLHISKNSIYTWFSSCMKLLIDYIRKWSNLTVKVKRRKLR